MSSTAAGPTLALGRILIADADLQAQRLAAETFLNQGAKVAQAADGRGLIALLRDHQPDVLILDIDLPQTQLTSLVQLLRTTPRTHRLPIVLTCPRLVDKHRLRELLHAGVSTVLVKPATAETLRDKVQQAIAQPLPSPAPGSAPAKGPGEQSQGPRESANLKSQIENSPAAFSHAPNPAAAVKVTGNNALLQRPIVCPFHEDALTPSAPTFARYTLRSGKVDMALSFFDLPIYTRATTGTDFINYHLLAVMVCPRCFFASLDPDYFLQPGNSKHTPRDFQPNVVGLVQKRLDQRRQAAAGISADFFNARRTLADALIAYDLALRSSQTLLDADKYGFALELTRLGNNHLRAAHLRELEAEGSGAGPRLIPPKDQPPRPLTEVEVAHYQAALETFKQAYVLLEGPALFKTVYQMTAVALWLGVDETAYRGMECLKNYLQKEGISHEDKVAAQRYLNRCQTAWEDRDYHRMPTA